LPFIDNEKQFFIHRIKILDQPTSRQSQVAMSAATANIDNDQKDEEQHEPEESATKKDQKQKNF
jgi:hypothetical protein